MTRKNKQSTISHAELEQALRYGVVCGVLSRIAMGAPLKSAVAEVAAMPHQLLDGEIRCVSRRSIYRWLAAYGANGTAGLANKARGKVRTSRVLPESFIEFLACEKTDDPQASIPEIIKRAVERGVLASVEAVHRSTVYRAAQRMGLPVGRRQGPGAASDQRRFAYPHRMQMVLCDGKHFRVGATRAKRVALIFIDDCTRMALHAVVGSSETSELFLRGLYELICKYGLMEKLYLDNGSGFIALETLDVVQALDVLLIHGTAGYPEGRGKIERLNRELKKNVLRHWAHPESEIDPECGALELRLRHHLDHGHNRQPHSSLGDRSPEEVFDADPRELQFPENDQQLRDKFVVYQERLVTADNVLSVDGIEYDVPSSHAKTKVRLHFRLLDGGIWLPHDDKLVLLHPLDPALNARTRRGRRRRKKQDTQQRPPTKSAADLAFERDHRPVVDADGGYLPTDDENDNHDSIHDK